MLGLNCQNKPNGFSSCCVLRGGAEMKNAIKNDPHGYERNFCNCVEKAEDSVLQWGMDP